MKQLSKSLISVELRTGCTAAAARMTKEFYDPGISKCERSPDRPITVPFIKLSK